MRILHIEEVESTNSYVERHVAELQHGDVITAECQTAGRGQRGNSWESAPGKNLTFTLLLKPRIQANMQFSLSSMVALQICEVLEELCGVACKVKWPNDIYTTDDRKICGILISHSLQGRNICHSVVGAGININQDKFISNAPNPVSVFQLTGKIHPLNPLLKVLAERIIEGCELLSNENYRALIACKYRENLWRGDHKFYPFRDTSSGEIFKARVEDIETSGHLLLCDEEGKGRRFAFKEVEWL